MYEDMRLLMKVNDARFKRLINECEQTERKREKALRDAIMHRWLVEKTEMLKEMSVACKNKH